MDFFSDKSVYLDEEAIETIVESANFRIFKNIELAELQRSTGRSVCYLFPEESKSELMEDNLEYLRAEQTEGVKDEEEVENEQATKKVKLEEEEYPN